MLINTAGPISLESEVRPDMNHGCLQASPNFEAMATNFSHDPIFGMVRTRQPGRQGRVIDYIARAGHFPSGLSPPNLKVTVDVCQIESLYEHGLLSRYGRRNMSPSCTARPQCQPGRTTATNLHKILIKEKPPRLHNPTDSNHGPIQRMRHMLGSALCSWRGALCCRVLALISFQVCYAEPLTWIAGQ
jgi:hypothetical protein